jgi:lipopolysaccharide/colanic/teichoic acid biosynthesis glycosyltransferase
MDQPVIPSGEGVDRVFSPTHKRAFDIIVGGILLIGSAPLFPIVALLVKLTSPGPVFFRQERIGKGGRPFMVTKFRSMYANVDSDTHRTYFKQYLRGEPAANEKGTVFKMHSDPRITPAGRMLRRLGLDELPQLFEVVRGDMSLVGPRPPLEYEVADYDDRHMQRLLVNPGITGLWQVRGRDIVNFEQMVDMDLEYIHKVSLWLDLKIVLLTVPSLIWAFVTR